MQEEMKDNGKNKYLSKSKKHWLNIFAALRIPAVKMAYCPTYLTMELAFSHASYCTSHRTRREASWPQALCIPNTAQDLRTEGDCQNTEMV